MKEPRISETQVEEIKAARKANQNKKIEKRLYVLEMYGAGKRQKEMQEVMAAEKQSQEMLEEAFRGIGYGIE